MPLKNGYDIPEGVVGGQSFVVWQTFYDGRPQGGKECADTSEEAEEAGRERVAGLKAGFCGYPTYLYPDPSLWEIRLWEG